MQQANKEKGGIVSYISTWDMTDMKSMLGIVV